MSGREYDAMLNGLMVVDKDLEGIWWEEGVVYFEFISRNLIRRIEETTKYVSRKSRVPVKV